MATDIPTAGETVTYQGAEILVQFSAEIGSKWQIEGRYIAEDGTVDALASITATPEDVEVSQT